ncbi:phosphotransferase [Microbispora sp. NBRC 16548]|uniref:phosphotransferase n=1 Tax=Microbispora sp. NBRC 16548 TaxID=3030994 RepID=UPI0024A0D077|nr:phosphotransferase [Microbispora sp. NBRC 16548]GLX09007.1 aminoglycoside phosphotransferase [Microbispora sp. NBRC 16548]
MTAALSGDGIVSALCHAAGVDSRGASLIRICANAVYYLPRANAVVRIATVEAAAKARRAIRMAHWLEDIGFPAVRVHVDVPETVVMDGAVATFWQYLPQPGRAPSVVRLAPLLRRLHKELPPFPLPPWDPVSDARANLQLAVGMLADRDREFLLQWCDRLDRELHSNPYRLPYGLIHGDAWAGNLLWHGDEVVLCDLDQMCHGPLEWDLVPTVVNGLRFGHPSVEEFLGSYGFDVMAAESFSLLRQARELTMLTGALPALSSRPSVAREISRRIEDLRVSGLGRWTPYE